MLKRVTRIRGHSHESISPKQIQHDSRGRCKGRYEKQSEEHWKQNVVKRNSSQAHSPDQSIR